MASLTFTIEPDELLGLSALVELARAADGGDPDSGTGTGTGAVSKAQALMRRALADKLEQAGLPWAPSAEAASKRAAEAAAPASALRGLTGNGKARKGAAYAAAAALVAALWGGYIRGWQWTGFRVNGQLWDWLTLLLLPVVLGTIPLWIQDKEYIGKGRRLIYAAAITAWTGLVIAGYLIPLNWTGFRGQTLWDWLNLLVLPAAITTVDGADQHASPAARRPPAPASQDDHRRPGRRVDRDRDRRLRPAVEVDRLSRTHSMGLARDVPATGIPGHPASALAQMGLGQCGRARQRGIPGDHGPDGHRRSPNIAMRTHSREDTAKAQDSTAATSTVPADELPGTSVRRSRLP